MKVLLVTMYFPPAGGGGVQRPLKIATHLPTLGVETHVLAPDDPKWIHRDEELAPPSQALVHRARNLAPRGRLPAEELYGRSGLDRAARMALLTYRRVLVPDASVPWNLTAIPAAIRLVREHGIDVVITTSPPGSVHFVGAAVKRATGVRWVADLRDSLVHNADRAVERLAARMKERGQALVGRTVGRSADAVVAVSEFIADEAREFGARRVATIPNGCDFDDFAGLEYRRGQRFRITHTGSFFGKRDPRPFLTALAESDLDVVARFAGGMRKADREWADALGLGDRLELMAYVPHRRSLELQRDSEALLLLLPEAGGRGASVPSGKIFEYLAAERPILAAVPVEGAAAALVREADAGIVVPPDDPAAIGGALRELVGAFHAGTLDGKPLAPDLRERLSRRTRVRELADLLAELT